MLQQLENQARHEKVGAWGVNAGRLNAHTQTPPAFSSFVAEGNTRSSLAPPDSPAVVSPFVKPAARFTRSSFETTGSHAKEKIPLGNIDINTATEKELTTVPGIGYVMAGRIIAARPFRSADDLKKVSGIGEKKYALIRPYFQ
jgi:competence protein ComEA